MSNKKCLLIIDVQEAMFMDPDCRPFREKKLIENIQDLLEKARLTNTSIIYIQHTEKDGLFEKMKATWEIYKPIKPEAQDIVIEKTSWDAFLNTTLDKTLKALSIDHLVIAGMQTEFCLDTSIRSAYALEYKCTVAKDGHSTYSNDLLTGEQIVAHHSAIWHGRFANLVDAKEINF